SAYLFGVAVVPNRTLAQKPVRRQPGARQQDRRPPRVSREDHSGSYTTDHLNHAGRDEIHGDRQRRAGHSEVKVACHREVAGERGILEVSHAGRTHAGLSQPIVEPSGGTVAETGAKRLVNRTEHLEQHEDRAGKREWPDERMAVLHSTDQDAHRDGKCRRKDSSERESRPPGRSQAAVSLRQDTEELPFLARG